jgi:hypothetical protein
MSLFVIPTFQDPSWLQSSTFEGTKFQLQFDFNERCASWYLSIADADGVDIYNGVKIVCGPLLLKKCRDIRRPAGDLICLSSKANDTSPPSLQDLLPGSGRCTLLYVTSDWLAIIESGNLTAIAGLFAQIAAGAPGTSPLSTYGRVTTVAQP